MLDTDELTMRLEPMRGFGLIRYLVCFTDTLSLHRPDPLPHALRVDGLGCDRSLY